MPKPPSTERPSDSGRPKYAGDKARPAAEAGACRGKRREGGNVSDMTPEAYCNRRTQGKAEAGTEVTEGTADGETTRVGAGDTAARASAEAGKLDMNSRGPT